MYLDRTLRSGWWRFVQLWRPLALWTLLVYALFGLIMGPLASAVVSFFFFQGDRVTVGNEDIAVWLLTPEGMIYALIAGGLAAMGSVLQYAGMYRILTDDMSGQPVSVRQTLLEMAPDVPVLFKLCVVSVAALLVLVAPLLLGVAGIYFLWLGEHDINYYLFAQPPEWYTALTAAGIFGVLWVAAAGYLVLRCLPALPAFLDGHRPIHVAVRRAWRRTRGDASRVLWLLLFCLGAWFIARVAAQSSYYFVAAAALETLIGVVGTLSATVLISGAWIAGSVVLDAAISFVGFSLTAIVLTKFYYEDTDLHEVAPPSTYSLGRISERAVSVAGRWIHPRRSVPLLLVLILLSVALSGLLLRSMDEEPGFVISAHRAGMHLATENTLLALERTIQTDADFAEIDVQVTRDSVVVVKHDADLMRLANDPRRIATTNYTEISDLVLGVNDEGPPEERRLATLEEFLDRSQGRIDLMIELKYYDPAPHLAELVVDQVVERGMEDGVVIISFDLAALEQVNRLAPQIETGYLATVSVGDLTRLPVEHLAVPRPMATERLLRAAGARDIDVHVWTLNDRTAMLDLAQRGAHGIITDDPRIASQLRRDLQQLTTAERLLLRLRPYLPRSGDDSTLTCTQHRPPP